MSPEIAIKIGEAAGKFGAILYEAIRKKWDEERVIEEIRKTEIVSTEGLEAMREAVNIRDEYVKPK